MTYWFTCKCVHCGRMMLIHRDIIGITLTQRAVGTYCDCHPFEDTPLRKVPESDKVLAICDEVECGVSELQ